MYSAFNLVPVVRAFAPKVQVVSMCAHGTVHTHTQRPLMRAIGRRLHFALLTLEVGWGTAADRLYVGTNVGTIEVYEVFEPPEEDSLEEEVP